MRPIRIGVRSLLLCVVVWLRVGFVATPVLGSESVASSLLELSSNSVSAFASRELPAAMREGKIPGAVFVVVQGGRVLCERAYGVADLKTGRPVSTDQTLFRAASISKILTAAAALQLVHAHKLDLRRDVNDYLERFHIAPAFGEPVTLFNLLTHSSGFDQCEFGYAARTAADKLSLRAYLTRYQPARVRPPGVFSVYDNYGFALAGYLVQRVSGVPFADYVRRHLLIPLNMERSGFSPGPKMRRHLATGYWLDEGEPRPYGQHYINITPAAGLCTTAADMADFLVALLANRQADGAKMFSPGVLNELETSQFTSAPEVPGRCFGFNEIILSGRSALRQPGQWPGFNSLLLLFPKRHCGLFLAYNLCDYEHLDRLISRKFAEAFIPPDTTGAPVKESSDSRMAKSLEPLSGYYLSLRSAYESPALNFPGGIRVTQAPDGTLEINGQSYRELEPLVFEKIATNGSDASWPGSNVAFRRAADGTVTHLITQGGTYRRADWLASRRGREFLLGATTAVFASVILLWPLLFLLRRTLAGTFRTAAADLTPRSPTFSLMARGTALAACFLALWFEAAFALAEMRLKPFADFYGLPGSIQKLLWALPALLGLTVVLAVFSIIIWRRRLWHPMQRWHYTLLVVACVVFLGFFYSRHLLFVG